MDAMSAKPEAARVTAMIVEREAVAPHLLDEETRYERLVMLESGPGGTRVRKLTMREKLDHADRTEGSVFAGSGEELEEMFDLLKEPDD
jgi:hypothetical protein